MKLHNSLKASNNPGNPTVGAGMSGLLVLEMCGRIIKANQVRRGDEKLIFMYFHFPLVFASWDIHGDVSGNVGKIQFNYSLQ